MKFEVGITSSESPDAGSLEGVFCASEGVRGCPLARRERVVDRLAFWVDIHPSDFVRWQKVVFLALSKGALAGRALQPLQGLSQPPTPYALIKT